MRVRVQIKWVCWGLTRDLSCKQNSPAGTQLHSTAQPASYVHVTQTTHIPSRSTNICSSFLLCKDHMEVHQTQVKLYLTTDLTVFLASIIW